MKTINIRIYGIIRGYIWMPNTECTKEFNLRLSFKSEPFAYQIGCLRDALLHITNDGDFQSCEIEYAVLQVTKQKGLSRIIRERELAGSGENADCFIISHKSEIDG